MVLNRKNPPVRKSKSWNESPLGYKFRQWGSRFYFRRAERPSSNLANPGPAWGLFYSITPTVNLIRKCLSENPRMKIRDRLVSGLIIKPLKAQTKVFQGSRTVERLGKSLNLNYKEGHISKTFLLLYIDGRVKEALVYLKLLRYTFFCINTPMKLKTYKINTKKTKVFWDSPDKRL